jgi:hypothetical protein
MSQIKIRINSDFYLMRKDWDNCYFQCLKDRVTYLKQIITVNIISKGRFDLYCTFS